MITRQLKDRGERALVPFFTAGYPDEETFMELVRNAADTGCHVIEIGVPFSDPIADGPFIQESSGRALAQGITPDRCLDLARDLTSEISTPVVFMTYFNPILRMGFDRFADRSAAAGVTGVIIPDVPFEESYEIQAVFKKWNIMYIGLVAPTSSDDRIERIVQSTNGFLYLVSISGVTGTKAPDARELTGFVGRVRARTDRPLYVGFGISDAERAKAATRHADGVIIGSALIRMIKTAHDGDAVRKVRVFLGDVKAAIQPDPI